MAQKLSVWPFSNMKDDLSEISNQRNNWARKGKQAKVGKYVRLVTSNAELQRNNWDGNDNKAGVWLNNKAY